MDMPTARIQYLSSPEIRQLTEEMLALPPDKVALRLHGKVEHPAWIAAQVASLQKAKAKLPTWFERRCILLPVPLEQCTSEAACTLKPQMSGRRLLDLTCGLGVDAWHFSHTFEEVAALEQEPELAALAQHNMALLGRPHVKVIHAKSEDFLAQTQERWDAIYVDPARRTGTGQRSFLLQDCSPDLIALQQRLRELAPEVWVKVSPLFDLREGLRLLHPVAEARVIAVEGEVKEVMFQLVREATTTQLTAAWLRRGHPHTFSAPLAETPPRHPFDIAAARFVLEPDVALYKAGLEAQWMQTQCAEAALPVAGGYFFSSEEITGFAGTAYAVQEAMAYQPEKVRKRLQALGIKRVNLTRKAFDVPLEQVRAALRVAEGGDHFLLLTRDADGKRWTLLAARHPAH